MGAAGLLICAETVLSVLLWPAQIFLRRDAPAQQ